MRCPQNAWWPLFCFTLGDATAQRKSDTVIGQKKKKFQQLGGISSFVSTIFRIAEVVFSTTCWCIFSLNSFNSSPGSWQRFTLQVSNYIWQAQLSVCSKSTTPPHHLATRPEHFIQDITPLQANTNTIQAEDTALPAYRSPACLPEVPVTHNYWKHIVVTPRHGGHQKYITTCISDSAFKTPDARWRGAGAQPTYTKSKIKRQNTASLHCNKRQLYLMSCNVLVYKWQQDSIIRDIIGHGGNHTRKRKWQFASDLHALYSHASLSRTSVDMSLQLTGQENCGQSHESSMQKSPKAFHNCKLSTRFILWHTHFL